MPRKSYEGKMYDEMTEEERDQCELDNLDDAYYKTQAEMDEGYDDSNDKAVD